MGHLGSTPKFMAETTLHETKAVVGPVLLRKFLNMVNDNDMSLNATKTKHLPLNFTKDVKTSQDLYIEGNFVNSSTSPHEDHVGDRPVAKSCNPHNIKLIIIIILINRKL